MTFKSLLIGSVVLSLAIFPVEKVEAQGKAASFEALTGLNEAFRSLVNRVSPAVVQISVTGYSPNIGAVTPSADLLSPKRGTGSGVILDPAGYVVTNAHVVAGARRIQVILPSSTSIEPGKGSILKSPGRVIGAQILRLDSETDLAILKTSEADLPSLPLGDSDSVQQGELVFAFGSPLGLEASVTMGVVSSIARQLRPEDPLIYIQTDAPINPGNSGGPLVNARGKVIGINSLIFSQSGGSEGIGFAAPSNIVRNVFEQIRETGRVRRGEIGVHAQTINATLAGGLSLTRSSGVILADVYPGSPGEKAGLEIGDIILAQNGKLMENGRQFHVNLYNQAIGKRVRLDILRGAEEISLTIPIAERSDDPERFSDLVTPERNLISKLGILGLNLESNIASMIPGLRNRSGVVVAAISAETLSRSTSFLPGDVIHAINGEPVNGLEGLRNLVSTLTLYDPIVAQIERRGRFEYLSFEVE